MVPRVTLLALLAALAALAVLVAPSPALAMRDSYTILLQYVTPLDSRYQESFERARERWQTVVLGTPVNYPLLAPAGYQLCRGEPESVLSTDTVLNDIIIFVKVHDIDGPGEVLGQAGICAFDDAKVPMPRSGWLELDVADVASLYAAGSLDAVVLHEIGHLLGIGSSWSGFGLTRSRDYMYRGKFGNRGNKQLRVKNKLAVIENRGGAGTARVHWRESVYKNELMTGYISGRTQPMSALTILSLRDLGYTVDASQAEAYRPSAKKKAKALRGSAPASAESAEDEDETDVENKVPFHSPNEKTFDAPIVLSGMGAGGAKGR